MLVEITKFVGGEVVDNRKLNKVTREAYLALTYTTPQTQMTKLNYVQIYIFFWSYIDIHFIWIYIDYIYLR
jgi:hypothetical protein